MNSNLITITYYSATKNIIDVEFTKGDAQRTAMLSRKEFEDWIERTDRNDVSITYTDNEDRTMSLPIEVSMCKYWDKDEISEEHHKQHLYDFIILNNLHYDEELQKLNAAAPTTARQNITASVPAGYGSKEAFEDEQSVHAAILEDSELYNAHHFSL